MEIVSRPHVENFIKWSASRPEVLVLSADLTSSCEVGQWRDTYPDRFVTAAMAEQNMLGVAAGLAREGFVPFIHTSLSSSTGVPTTSWPCRWRIRTSRSAWSGSCRASRHRAA